MNNNLIKFKLIIYIFQINFEIKLNIKKIKYQTIKIKYDKKIRIEIYSNFFTQIELNPLI